MAAPVEIEVLIKEAVKSKLDKINAGVAKFKTKSVADLKKVQDASDKLTKTLLETNAALPGLAKAGEENSSTLQKLAGILGITTSELKVLQQQVDETGVPVQGLSEALATLSASTSAATQNNRAVAATLAVVSTRVNEVSEQITEQTERVEESADAFSLLKEVSKRKLAQIAAFVLKFKGFILAALKAIGIATIKLTKLFLGLGLAVTVLAAVALPGLVTSGLESANALQIMAQASGVTTEELSTLQFAADQSGTSLEDLSGGLKELAKNALLAQRGNKKASDTFEILGIKVEDGNKKLKGQTRLLLEVADAFQSLKDGAVKTTLAQDLFSSSGEGLIPTLNQGSAAIREMQTEARELGLELSTSAGIAAGKYTKSMKKIESATEGAGRVIAVEFADDLVIGAEAIAGFAKSGGDSLRDFFRFFKDQAKNVITLVGLVSTGVIRLTQLPAEGVGRLSALLEEGTGKIIRTIGDFAGDTANLLDKVPLLLRGVTPGVTLAIKGLRGLSKAVSDEADTSDKRLDKFLADNKKRVEENSALAEEFLSKFVFPDTDPVKPGVKFQVRQRTKSQKERGEGIEDRAGAGVEDPAIARERTKQERLQAIRDQAAKRAIERAEEIGLSELQMLQLRQDRELAIIGDNQAAITAVEAFYGEERANLEEKIRDKRIQDTGTFFGSLGSIFQSAGSKLFKIGQKFAIAEALVNTYAGATQALRLPFPSNIAALAKTLAAGFKQVKSIKSTQPGSAGSVGGVGSGSVSSRAAPAAPPPLEAPGAREQGVVNFIFEGDVLDEDKLALKVGGIMEGLSQDRQLKFTINRRGSALSSTGKAA